MKTSDLSKKYHCFDPQRDTMFIGSTLPRFCDKMGTVTFNCYGKPCFSAFTFSYLNPKDGRMMAYPHGCREYFHKWDNEAIKKNGP